MKYCSNSNEVEQQARGKSLSERLEISIDILTEYLFNNPEVSNLILFGYFSKTDPESVPNIKIDDYTSGIAVAMNLAEDKAHVPVQAKARILAVWNCVLNFISGENFFRPILNVDRPELPDGGQGNGKVHDGAGIHKSK